MKQRLILGLLVTVFVFSGLPAVHAQESEETNSPKNDLKPTQNAVVSARPGTIIRPQSSQPATNNGTTLKTMKARTNIEIYMPDGWKPDEVAPPGPDELPPFPGYAWETPASLACLYSLVAATPGCNPNLTATNPIGGSKAIALVEAYDDPFAGPDLAYFSAQFGLPFKPEQLQVVYQSGVEPPVDPTGGWELEASLDMEYSHAMAPNAIIYLVEANTESPLDLLASVKIASNLVRCGKTTTCPASSKGTGEVSMSWGFLEFPTETSYDSYFATPGVVYFAASGDGPGTLWPCVSANVVCTGGTTIRRSPVTGNFLDERTWADGGGGASQYVKIPPYQSSISGIVGTARGVPDVSLDSNPDTGVWVWDSSSYDGYGAGWWILGGTSVAAPTWAGIVNRAGAFAASSSAELTTIYMNKANPAYFNDITMGFCGPYAGYLAVAGWDPCSGVGSNKGYGGK